MDLEKFYTRCQAAKALRVSTRTIDRWLKSGKVRYVTFHRVVLISRDEIHQFVESR